MEKYSSDSEFFKSIEKNSIKLDFIVWYTKLNYLVLTVFFGGLVLLILGTNSKNIVFSTVGSLSLILAVILMIIYTKIYTNDKYFIALCILKIATLIESYKVGAENLVKKNVIFYFQYLSNYFEEHSSSEFFDKNEILFDKFVKLTKRFHYALTHNQILKYDTSKIKKLSWELYSEKEIIYKNIDFFINVIKKEESFKTLGDHLKKLIENKYVKFLLFEALIILIVLSSHFQFPTYVEKDKVFWAIIILTGVNLTINFTKK